MKRNEHIRELSREHHFGLLFCWKIRQGLKKGVDISRMQAYVAYFWKHHLQNHFEAEEQILFARIQHRLCNRALDEHRRIRASVEDIGCSAAVAAEQLIFLTDSIDDHIRFEERLLFPMLEQELPEQELVAIGAGLAALHQEPISDNFPDQFWI
jgi:hemerythrin-like domain-containing protein